MTRHSKSEHQKKRVLIQFRMTDDEKRSLREFAKLAGMNLTDFVKTRTLGKKPRTKMATPDREVLILLMAELSKIGSNINQIARVMNSEKRGYSVTVKETYIMETLAVLRNLSAAILTSLDKGLSENETLTQS